MRITRVERVPLLEQTCIAFHRRQGGFQTISAAILSLPRDKPAAYQKTPQASKHQSLTVFLIICT